MYVISRKPARGGRDKSTSLAAASRPVSHPRTHTAGPPLAGGCRGRRKEQKGYPWRTLDQPTPKPDHSFEASQVRGCRVDYSRCFAPKRAGRRDVCVWCTQSILHVAPKRPCRQPITRQAGRACRRCQINRCIDYASQSKWWLHRLVYCCIFIGIFSMYAYNTPFVWLFFKFEG